VKVTVLGAGSWGTTLALVLNQNNHRVTCWSFDKSDIDSINKLKENKKFLPGINIPDTVSFTNDLQSSVDSAEVIIVAIPSHAVRSVVQSIDLSSKSDLIWVNVAKGIENGTLLRISQVIGQVGHVSSDNIAVLFGPSHAEEVSREIPTAIVSASKSKETAKLVQHLFMTPYFRVYANLDLIGVELGGALKNIIAVAAGICDGAGFGDNTKAALMTRGLVEINRLGIQMGAKPDTFAGLSGMGDLIVTCTSKHSRNRYVGEQIGKGRPLQDVLNEMVMVAEGVKTTASAYELSLKEGVEMPITEQVYRTLFEGKPPVEAMQDLMTRASKIEDWG
jgi:glycerol-3-phosphate dehydrogenase (NAD(P)+)